MRRATTARDAEAGRRRRRRSRARSATTRRSIEDDSRTPTSSRSSTPRTAGGRPRAPSPPPSPPPAPLPRRPWCARADARTSPSRRPGKSWPTPTTSSPPTTSRPAGRLPAEDRRGLGARAEGHRPRARRARARFPPRHQGRRGPRRARADRRRQNDKWDRVVGDLPGRHRRVRPDRDRGGAAPRRRPRCASGSGRSTRSRSCTARSCGSSRTTPWRWSGSRRSAATQERWEDLANVLEKRTGGAQRGVAARRRAARAPARAGEAVRGAAGAALRGDRHARAPAVARRPRRSDATAEAGERPSDDAEMLGAHEALARLYSRVGLWGKVVESLQRQAELTTDRRQRARAAAARSPTVYEKELGRRRARHRGLRGDPGRGRPTTRRRWRRSIASTRPTAASRICRRS